MHFFYPCLTINTEDFCEKMLVFHTRKSVRSAADTSWCLLFSSIQISYVDPRNSVFNVSTKLSHFTCAFDSPTINYGPHTSYSINLLEWLTELKPVGTAEEKVCVREGRLCNSWENCSQKLFCLIWNIQT